MDRAGAYPHQAESATEGKHELPRDLFVQLFARHHNQLLAFILTFVPNRSDAEEIFQESSLTLWQCFARYDSERDFGRWARGIALNQIRSHRRRNLHRGLPLSDAVVDALAETRERMEPQLTVRRQAMLRCIQKLRPIDRDLVEIYYGTSNSADWVAQRVGRSVQAVYKAIKRIRRKLYECVGHQDMTASSS